MIDYAGVAFGAVLGGAVAGLAVWALGRWTRARLDRSARSEIPLATAPNGPATPSPEGPVGDGSGAVSREPGFADSSRPEGPARDAVDAHAMSAAASAPRSPNVPPGDVRLSRRIVLHLAAQPRVAPDDVALPAHTQSGIGEALHANQSAIAKVLRRLVAAGVVREDRRHVRGQDRRLKVYVLSPRGETLARELRSRSSVSVERTRPR